MENNENLNVNELNSEDMEQVSGGRGSGQRVKATGDVYVRRHPDKDSADLGVLYKGETAAYLGEKRWDDRDVMWYKVRHNGNTGWVSSRYAKLVN